jgi:hypothetical protein
MTSRYLIAFVAVAILAGCGGAQTPTTPQTTTQSVKAQAHHGSWMLPEANSEDLLYASDNTGGQVYVFSYPKGTLVGTLSGFDSPVGICVDNVSDVWVVNQLPPEVVEYAHGGTEQIGTLSTGAGTWPYGCAIDSKTGNLAVVVYPGNGIEVFPNAQSPAVAYPASDFAEILYCAYDNNSNLFSMGYSKSLGATALAELPNGGSELKSIPLNRSIRGKPFAVQWDGKALTIGGYKGYDWKFEPIYRVSVSASEAKIVGTARLENQGHIYQEYLIRGRTVVQASDDVNGLSFWHYPEGGAATKTIANLGELWGEAVSTAPQKRVPGDRNER